MPAAAIPANEAARLDALRSYHIIDSSAEAGFDDLTRQAMEICATPVALLSFVDEKRQWFKSRLGFSLKETSRDQSFCAHALLASGQPLIVPDASLDPRFADNPLVIGDPKIRFYAGIPLRSPEGHGLGALCVIDHVPRQLSPDQIDKLRAIAQQVSVRLGLRRHAPAERRLVLGFGLGFALLLCMAVFFVAQAARFFSSDQWVTHTNQVIRDIERSLFEVQAAESSQRGYTATGQPTYLPPYKAALEALPPHLAALGEAIADNPFQQQEYRVFKSRILAKLAIMEERIEQRRTLGAVALDPRYLNDRGRKAMVELIAIGQKMIEAENGLLLERAAARAGGLHAAIGMLLGTSTLGAGLVFAGFLLTRRELRRSHTLGDALARANMGLENEVIDRRRAQERLGVQHDIARIAAENVSLAKAAPHFLRAICEHLDWSLGEVWAVDPVANVMRLADCWHSSTAHPSENALVAGFVAATRGWKFAKGEGLPGRAWSEGSAAWEHNLEENTCFLRTAEARNAGLRRAFVVPLRDGIPDEVTGAMVFLGKERGAPDPELIVTMNTLAGQIAQFAERCRATIGLRASQARFSAFMENAPVIAYIKDEEGRMLYGNQTLLDRFGVRSEEWLGKTDYDLWPAAAPAIRAHDQQVLSGEGAVEVRESVPTPDGGLSHWLSYKFPLYEGGTNRKLLAGMSVDITARERAEAALRAEREFLAALLDNLQAGVIACDAQGRLTHCNRAAMALHGFPVDDALPPVGWWGDYFDLLTEGEGELIQETTDPLAYALRGEVIRDREFVLRPKYGPERAVSLNVAPFEDGSGGWLGAVAVIHDVTARRQAREAALLSVREKETLLQEVHHRVKNNLQIIGSLLSMQARRTKSPAALTALGESASRVRSIALVHEKLYRSQDLECIEAADFLRSLSRNLMEALGSERVRLQGRVSLDFDLEEGHQLDASMAIACGLIVNEALTNSLKHGFPDKRVGRVTVALTRLENEVDAQVGACSRSLRIGQNTKDGHPADHWLRLEIRDDGIGLSPECYTVERFADMARNSLGMRLVRDLSKQVNGRFEFVPTDVETGQGLTLRVMFPVATVELVA